jgi:two-component system OmpR family sensor kinase
MSLRARLLAGLVALAAAGLVVVGVVTYAEQRSFLLQRVDQQVIAAPQSVSRALDDAGVNVPGHTQAGFGQAGLGQPRGSPGASPAPRGGSAANGGPPGGGVGPGPRVSLPPGTYAQRRDASGHSVGSRPFTYGQRALAPPRLPAQIPLSTPGHERLITVGSVGKTGVRYRVISVPTSDEPGTTIIAIPLLDVDQTLNRLLEVEALVAGGVLLALVALAWWVIRLGLRPLDRMGQTANAIAAGDLSRRVLPATSRTEVGRLGLALNAMLVQIENAFGERRASEERLRRFLADASHELRTPLASIRGYAELFRIGAARNPADVAKSMNRIEDEAMRMGVLVEDLLTLARLDEVPEPVRQRVDLTRLAGDATDDARATAPDRAIELDSNGPVVVLGDPDQLRQVIANMVRNALVHTPAGTPIELRVTASAGDGVVEVRDHGPGLPAGASDAIFGRFWRADPGRGRGRAGAGLGLAIVAEILAAHGGRAEAANAEGGGASFVIRVPVTEGSARPSHRL